MGNQAADHMIDAFVASIADIDFVALCGDTHPFRIRVDAAKLVLDSTALATMSFATALLPPAMIDAIIEIIEAADDARQRDMASRVRQVMEKAAVDRDFCEMFLEKWSQSDVCLALIDAFGWE
jgi:hypothetical protein